MNKNNIYTYHYHAIWQPDLLHVANLDGIALLTEPINSNEQYTALKVRIAEEVGATADKVTICSLSQLASHLSAPTTSWSEAKALQAAPPQEDPKLKNYRDALKQARMMLDYHSKPHLVSEMITRRLIELAL